MREAQAKNKKEFTMRRYVIVFIITFVTIFSLSEISAYGYGWGYKKGDNNELPDFGKYADIIKEHAAIYADLSGDKVIYFTFDNGYEQGYTAQILDVLKENKVPATFFVTGHYVKSEPELVKRMVDEGHIIGNHSYHHPDFTTMSKDEIKKELDMLEQAVAEVSDQQEMMYLRPPRGTFNENTLKWTSELGYVHVFWSLAFKDWETDKQRGWKYAYDEIVNQAHPGAIVLLHTVSKDNAAALDKAIRHLKEEGYQFKSLDELMMKTELPKEVMF